jgi:hypothetical protein
MAQMKKPASKRVSNGSDTKPYNVRPIKPAEIIKDKPATKGSVAKTFDASKLIPKMTPQDAAMLKILKKKYGNDVYKK